MRVTPEARSTGSASKEEMPYLHCDEQTLEEYCLGILNPRRIEAVEEHLLVCEECQDALAEQEEFIYCLKEALRTQPKPKEMAYFRQTA